MPLHDNGYLGRHNQEWSKAHQEKHKEVFGHLREVNRLCHEYLREHAVNPKNGPQVFATTYCTSPDKTDTEIWLTNAVCYRSECCTAFKVASRHKRHLPTGYPPFIPFALLNYVTHSEKE